MKILTLDLSTTSTGFAILTEDKTLHRYGVIEPKVKGLSKLKYPHAPLRRIISICSGVRKLIIEEQPDVIFVEEVNRGIQRISQKSLDALHFFVLLDLAVLGMDGKLQYMDSDGKTGWRSVLGLKLSEEQKKINKTRKKGDKFTKKHLAADYVNAHYGLAFDVDNNSTDSDAADAIGLGLGVIESGVLNKGPEECSSKSKSKSSGRKAKSKKKPSKGR